MDGKRQQKSKEREPRKAPVTPLNFASKLEVHDKLFFGSFSQTEKRKSEKEENLLFPLSLYLSNSLETVLQLVCLVDL